MTAISEKEFKKCPFCSSPVREDHLKKHIFSSHINGIVLENFSTQITDNFLELYKELRIFYKKNTTNNKKIATKKIKKRISYILEKLKEAKDNGESDNYIIELINIEKSILEKLNNWYKILEQYKDVKYATKILSKIYNNINLNTQYLKLLDRKVEEEIEIYEHEKNKLIYEENEFQNRIVKSEMIDNEKIHKKFETLKSIVTDIEKNERYYRRIASITPRNEFEEVFEKLLKTYRAFYKSCGALERFIESDRSIFNYEKYDNEYWQYWKNRGYKIPEILPLSAVWQK